MIDDEMATAYDISEDLILEMNDCTDISGKAQLLVIVGVPDSEDIIEHILLVVSC